MHTRMALVLVMLVATGVLAAHGHQLQIDGGTLHANGQLVVDSLVVDASKRLSGEGRFTGDGTVRGTLSPGDDARGGVGTLRFGGAVSFAAGSTLACQVGGTIPGISYDQLLVTGNLALSATTLTVTLANGFIPKLGNRFRLVTMAGWGAGTSQRDFATTNLPSLPAGLGWRLQYGTTAIELEAGPTLSPSGEAAVSGETLPATIGTAGGYVAFHVYGEAGNRLLARAAATAGTLDPKLLLYAPGSGASITSTTVGTMLDFRLPSSGVHNLIVSDEGADETGTVRVSIQRIPGPVSSPSDRDGGALGIGQTASGRIGAPTDMDAFHFYGAASDQITVTAVMTSGSLAPTLRLYPVDGGAALADSGNASVLNGTLPASGLYEAVVWDRTGANTGDYTLTLAKSPATVRPGLYSPQPLDSGNIDGSATTLSWGAVPAATGYDVYVGANLLGPLALAAAGLKAPSLVVSNLAPAEVYYWRVNAHTTGGDVGGPYWWFRTGGGPWSGATDVGQGWMYLDWFGYFSSQYPPWIYHLQHGWMYTVGDSTGNIWLYTSDMGWLWTSEQSYSWMFSQSQNSWLYYQKDSDSPRWFFNMNTQQWQAH